MLRGDHEAFVRFTAGLDAETREHLEAEHRRLNKAQERISARERELYEIYRKDQVRDRKGVARAKQDSETCGFQQTKISTDVNAFQARTQTQVKTENNS